MKEKCFACGKVIHRAVPLLADTRDDQVTFVGADCWRKVKEAGEAGYQPPRGGPRLYPFPIGEGPKRAL